MPVEILLSRLQKVRSLGANRWLACCPAHDDRRPSLRIRDDDGRILVRCMSHGCGFVDIVTALGMSASDFFPPGPAPINGIRPIRKPFFPSDVFETARFEVAVASMIARDIYIAEQVSEDEYDRLLLSMSRLNRIAEAAYGDK